MTTRNKFSPEVRGRAVRMVEEHRGDYVSEWSAVSSIAGQDRVRGRDAAPLALRGILR